MSEEKEKGPEPTMTLSSLPLTVSLGFIFGLNNPIDMQVSEQVGGSLLSL